MITVTIDRGSDCCLILGGHSGFAPAGQDIVCSSATTLAYAFAHAVIAAWKADELSDEPVIRMDPGDIEIRAQLLPEFEGSLDRTIDAIEDTYSLLERSYPDCIEII